MTFEEQLAKDGKLIYTNIGTSMMPLIRQRKDILIIETCDAEKLNKYDVVLYTRLGSGRRREYILHRILKVNGNNTYWIVGDHCTSGENVNSSDILGKLTCLIRDGKQITEGNRKYRMYVHLWCDLYPLRCFLIKNKGRVLYHWNRWRKKNET